MDLASGLLGGRPFYQTGSAKGLKEDRALTDHLEFGGTESMSAEYPIISSLYR